MGLKLWKAGEASREMEFFNSIMEGAMEKESPDETHLLDAFMKEVGRYPLLSREEETSLAIKAQEGNMEAREKLVNSNLRLILFFGKKYFKPGRPWMDMLSEACVGLIKAVDKFDPKKGFRFSTCAGWQIKGKILRCLHVHWRSDANSLDVPAFRDSEESKLNSIPSEDKGLDLEAEFSHAWKRLEILNGREREILLMRFGEDKDSPEIALKMGISKASVCQTITRALRKVRWDLNGWTPGKTSAGIPTS